VEVEELTTENKLSIPANKTIHRNHMANPVSNQEKGYTLNNCSSHTPESMYSSFRYCHWKMLMGHNIANATSRKCQVSGFSYLLWPSLAWQSYNAPPIALRLLLIEQAH